ncbi:hypothetical protein ACOI1H_20730 [Loktanella sp. DJP18]|uniref:hypothetical protein n=1 Tax=Loktanella sp. DJP18 TaxID=3409788 RepID=UPI003BB6615E
MSDLKYRDEIDNMARPEWSAMDGPDRGYDAALRGAIDIAWSADEEIARLRGMLEANGLNPDIEYIAKGGVRINAPLPNGHRQSCACPDCTPF